MGLSLSDARAVPRSLQSAIVAVQNDLLGKCARERVRGDAAIALKDYRRRNVDTLFGRVEVRMPRFRSNTGGKTDASIMNWPAHQRATPELIETMTRLGAWMSYRPAMSLMRDFLPVETGASLTTAWRKTVARGGDVAAENSEPIAGDAKQIHLSLDTTFIRSHRPTDGRSHEILIGQAENNRGCRAYFGAAFDDKDAAAEAMNAALAAVGRKPENKVAAFTDGAGALRQLCGKLGLKDKPILDWFHIAMRIRHISQAASGLSCETAEQLTARGRIENAVERIRWKLWRGHAGAMESGMAQVREVLGAYKGERKYLYQPAPSRKVWCGLFALEKYVDGQEAYTTNYAELHRRGKRVGTSMSESAAAHLVNARMNRNQHMRWSRNGAHRLVRLRAREFNRVYNSEVVGHSYAA